MDEIAPYLQGAKDPVALYSFHQVQGRGQYGNSWESQKGSSLAYSLGIPENLVSLSPELFNYHTAIVLREFLANLTSIPVEIKWPNDLIMRGKKVGGILIEKQKHSDDFYFVIGFGMNVAERSFGQIVKAGSLYSQTGHLFDLDFITTELTRFLYHHLLELKKEDEVLELFNQALFRKDKISVFEKGGTRQNGIIRYADASGMLHVELEEEGLKAFYHKQIQLLY